MSDETPNPEKELSGQNLPGQRGDHGEEVRVQRGMFGADKGGDTSGYGGLVRSIRLPGPAARPYGGWFDEVADELEERAGGAGAPPRERHREDGRRPRRAHLPHRARAPRPRGPHPARRPGAPLRALYRRLRRPLPRRQGPRAARRLPPALADPRPADPPGGLGPGQRAAHPVARRRLPDERLARARDVRLLRHRLRRPPRPHPDHDAGRLAGPPAAQGLPLGGIAVEYKGAQIPAPDQRRSYS